MLRIPQTILELLHFPLPLHHRRIRISQEADNSRPPGLTVAEGSGSMAAGVSKSRVRLRLTFRASWTISGSIRLPRTDGFPPEYRLTPLRSAESQRTRRTLLSIRTPTSLVGSIPVDAGAASAGATAPAICGCL